MTFRCSLKDIAIAYLQVTSRRVAINRTVVGHCSCYSSIIATLLPFEKRRTLQPLFCPLMCAQRRGPTPSFPGERLTAVSPT